MSGGFVTLSGVFATRISSQCPDNSRFQDRLLLRGVVCFPTDTGLDGVIVGRLISFKARLLMDEALELALEPDEPTDFLVFVELGSWEETSIFR